MADEAQAATEATGQAPNTTTTTDAGSVGEQAVTSGAQTVDGLPQWAQDLFSGLRKENAGHRTAKNDAEKAAKLADEKRLADDKKWEELAEQRQARITELEPLSEQVTSYQETLKAMADKAMEGLPEHIKPLLADRDPVWQLNYLTEHAAELAAPGPANINATSQSQGTPPPEITQQQIDEFAARAGVDPRFVDPELVRATLR